VATAQRMGDLVHSLDLVDSGTETKSGSPTIDRSNLETTSTMSLKSVAPSAGTIGTPLYNLDYNSAVDESFSNIRVATLKSSANELVQMFDTVNSQQRTELAKLRTILEKQLEDTVAATLASHDEMHKSLKMELEAQIQKILQQIIQVQKETKEAVREMQTRHTIQVAGLNKNIQVDLPTRYSQEIKDVQVRGQKKLIEIEAQKPINQEKYEEEKKSLEALVTKHQDEVRVQNDLATQFVATTQRMIEEFRLQLNDINAAIVKIEDQTSAYNEETDATQNKIHQHQQEIVMVQAEIANFQRVNAKIQQQLLDYEMYRNSVTTRTDAIGKAFGDVSSTLKSALAKVPGMMQNSTSLE